MEIYIPSSGRPNKQTTYDNLPKSLQARAIIVVPQAEKEAYAGYPVMGIQCVGIGQTRQWCIENAASGKVAMLDDDLVFATRRGDDPTRFYNASDSEIEYLFREIEEKLEDCPHVGVATREGGNRNTEPEYYCQRMLRVLCYNTGILDREGVTFDRLQVMEDFDVTLQLLSKSYPNIILNYMVHNQNGSNLAGGCSQYRTLDLQAAAAQQLAELWPRYVTLVTKTPKTAWGGETRLDVRISWKKCYNESLKRR